MRSKSMRELVKEFSVRPELDGRPCPPQGKTSAFRLAGEIGREGPASAGSGTGRVKLGLRYGAGR